MNLTRYNNPDIPDNCCYPNSSELWRITIPKKAHQNLSGHRMVKYVGVGEVDYPDQTSLLDGPIILGLTTGDIAIGNFGDIIVQGEVEDPAWTWTPTHLLYLSTSGHLIQSAPVSGLVKIIGVALSATRILVRIDNQYS